MASAFLSPEFWVVLVPENSFPCAEFWSLLIFYSNTVMESVTNGGLLPMLRLILVGSLLLLSNFKYLVLTSMKIGEF